MFMSHYATEVCKCPDEHLYRNVFAHDVAASVKQQKGEKSAHALIFA